MTLNDMTGTITDLDGPCGIPITFPKENDEGYWTPSDQDTCPITPIHVVFHLGMWYSLMAYIEMNRK